MWPVIGGLISGASSLLGGMFSNSANQQMMQQQMAFQQQMSNTAYQRASKDMTAAGLNPMMMFGGGSAASTPAGATGNMSGLGEGIKNIGNAINSGLQSAIYAKTVDKLTEEIAKTKAETVNVQARTKTEEKLPALREQETWATGHRGRVYSTEADINVALGHEYGLRGDIAGVLRQYYGNEYAQKLLMMARAGKDITEFLSPIRSLLSSAGSAKSLIDRRWP